ncbi:Hypothetical predicted protein [Octopus vulgaris]|uniref:Uncharacterized protein n=1 Tax=Octopus vulgaris TaxID=6645 RepID=A0AA36BGJ2_OCTVU|nr:Hypothetical predicted protein [Octopus vulgaris]
MAYFFSNNLLLILIGIAEILEIIQGYQLGQWFIEVQSAKLSSSESQTITEINITGKQSTGNPILPTTQSSLQNGEVMTSWKLQLFRTSDVIMKYGILVQIQSRTIFVFDTRRNSVVSNDGGQQIVVDTFTFQMLTRQGRLKSFLLWCLQQIDVNDNCIGLEVSLIVLTNLNTGQVYSSVFNKELTPIPSIVYV